MRPSFLVWSLLSVLAVPSLAASPEDKTRLFKRDDTAASKGKPGTSDSESFSTVFNGIEVPPMKELTPDNFESVTKDGYWSVHISCGSLRKVAQYS